MEGSPHKMCHPDRSEAASKDLPTRCVIPTGAKRSGGICCFNYLHQISISSIYAANFRSRTLKQLCPNPRHDVLVNGDVKRHRPADSSPSSPSNSIDFPELTRSTTFDDPGSELAIPSESGDYRP